MTMMKLLLPLFLLPAGCNLFGTIHASGRPVSDAYGGSHELRVLDVESPLRRERKLPVLSTPEVLGVYVPAHAERDLYLGDRWIFLKLKDSEWLSERLQDPDPLTTGEASPESLRPLREADWGRVVVPHK
jgi:hypothetical protein